MGFELGLEKKNLLGNGIRNPLHDPQVRLQPRNLESSRWSLQNFSYMGHVTRKSVGLPLTFCSSDDKNNHKNEDTPSRPM